MEETLRTLVEKHGMQAVLATLSQFLRNEADECVELQDSNAEPLEAIATQVLNAASAYDRLGATV